MKDSNYDNLLKRYGKTHLINKVAIPKDGMINLENLKPNQSVCFGDGKTYYIVLTSIIKIPIIAVP